MELPRTTADQRHPDLLLFYDAARRAAAYLEAAPARAVAPPSPAVDALEPLRPLAEGACSPAEVLAQIDGLGSPATVINTAGRYFGFVNGGCTPASLAASWLVSAWDQNVALRVMSPAGAFFEDVALDWARDILGLPARSAGAIVTGATMANFVCLAAARQAILQRAGWDAAEDGLFGAPPITVFVGDEVHVSLIKALGLLGLGRRRVTRLPVDEQGRIRVDALPRHVSGPAILCIQAGNVNTGAFDPARDLCAWAHAAAAWVHVDGAFGLWAAASPRYRHLADGFADADSWATDGHKWPNAGYDCGLAFVRQPDALRAAMATSSAYFVPGELREPSQFGPDMSRRARGVELWATLRGLGRNGLADLIDRTCAHARSFADALRQGGAEILNDVVINQVLVSFGSPELTRAVIARIQQDGVCWCGGTEWHGRAAMRISVSSWATTDEDVQVSVAAILRAAAECRAATGIAR
jgi:glutamate/tyrosine decarboxylase-like PLP-dependent enzyme